MSRQPSQHVSVLPDEVIEWLQPAPGMVIVDGTLGGGGHARRLAEAVGQSGHVIGLDRDPSAIEGAEQHLRGLPISVAQASFVELAAVLAELGIGHVDGVVLDLGMSSDQLADAKRGFRFDADGMLDLRFDPTVGEPAHRLLARLSERHLADLIYAFSEERFSRRIARAIVARRRSDPVETATQLADLVRRCLPRGGRDKIHPATRTFQALRIAVNDELQALDSALHTIPEHLKVGGRFAVISFHSLEDRRVKQAFRDDERLHVLTRRVVKPSDEEIANNPRARSARLRVAERSGTRGGS